MRRPERRVSLKGYVVISLEYGRCIRECRVRISHGLGFKLRLRRDTPHVGKQLIRSRKRCHFGLFPIGLEPSSRSDRLFLPFAHYR